MSITTIYTPGGEAAQYAHIGLNLYSGFCTHDCRYPCYVPDVLHIPYQQWRLDPPHPRKGVIAQLKKDAVRYYGIRERCHLTFMADCYQVIEQSLQITRQALIILRENKIPFQVLTKNPTLALRDLDVYGDECMLGTTLTCATDAGSFKIEPSAPVSSERINALRIAHEKGIKTWVSLEPVLEPLYTLELIRMTHEFVDHYKIGPLNHSDAKKNIDLRAFGISAKGLCEEYGVSYYLKSGLMKHLQGIDVRNTDTRTLARAVIERPKEKRLF